MPRNGTGGYSLPEAVFVSGTTIESAKENSNMADVATELTNSLAKDGQSTMTGALKMGSQKITGLAAGTAASDGARLDQVQSGASGYIATTGSANAYVATLSPAITAYAEGQSFRVKANFTNTGAATVNVNTLGAKNIFRNGAALTGGEIVSGSIVTLSYDGTQFQLLDNGATLGDGSAAAPSLRFGQDTNTGFYRISADKFGIATNGTLISSWGDAIARLLDGAGRASMATDLDQPTLSINPTHATFSQFGLHIYPERAASSAYRFARFTSGGIAGDVEFNFSGDGNGTCDGSWTGSGADYAEYFACDPGHMLASTPGVTVVVDGDKVRPAKDGEAPMGVSRPKEWGRIGAIIGNSPMNWPGKYMTDDFGRYLLDSKGERISTGKHDPKRGEYVSRAKRDEWALIGLLGQIPILKGQPVAPGWVRMREISQTVELWLVK